MIQGFNLNLQATLAENEIHQNEVTKNSNWLLFNLCKPDHLVLFVVIIKFRQ
jgi:hypothetical protein